MGIKSGTVTESVQEFYPEAILKPNQVRPGFKSCCDSLLTDGVPPQRSANIQRVGEFQGGWKFWNDLYSHEKENNFSFQPQFCVPSDGTRLPDWIVEKFELEDYKIAPRILYYPFGYFVVRVRIYFEFSREKDVSEFLEFERAVQDQLNILVRNGERTLQSVFRDINKFVFGGEVPDHYVGKMGDRMVNTITYLYESGDLSKKDRARIIRRKSRSVPDRVAKTVSEPYLGHLQGDQISVDPEGAAIITPSFSGLSERNRRWKRLHLLNNMYVAYDFALLERHHIKRIRDELAILLDEFNRSSVIRNPINPRALAVLEAILDFGIHLRVTRGEVYEELEPIEMKETVHPDIDQYIDRVLNHKSLVREFLSFIPRILGS